MMLSLILVLTTLTTFSASEEGVSDTDEWAYQWYHDEPFRFRCHIAGLNISHTDHVVWETPDTNILNSPYNGTDFQLFTEDNISGLELLVKRVHPSVHGVYICSVKDENEAVKGRTIYGLNIHDVKYHDMMDKYKHQIYVALVTTAVFLVPLLTTCFVWHFQYVTPEMEDRRQRRKGRQPYSVNNRMQMASNGRAESAKGNWTYDNEVFTQL